MEKGSVVKGTAQISSTQIIQYLVMAGFYVTVTKTGALTEADLGMISVLAFLAHALYLVASFSLPQALTKQVSENLEKGLAKRAAGVQKTINRSVILLLTIGYALVVVLSPQISQFLWKTDTYALLIVLMCFYAYFNGIINLYTSNLQALQLFGRVAVVTLLWVVLSRILGAVLAFLNFGIHGVLIGYVIGYGVACGASILFVKGNLPSSESYVSLKPLMNFSFPLFLGSLITLTMEWADIIFVTSLTADYAAVGVYYIAVRSATFLSVLWVPITYTIFPLLSGKHGTRDFQGVSEIAKTASRYLAFLMIPCCVGLIVLAPVALRFFYVEQYVAGAASLVVLGFAQIFLALYFILTTVLTSIGKTTSVLKVNVFSVLAYIVFLLLLVPSFQAAGAAAARLGMQILGLSVAIYMLSRYLKVQFDLEAFWKSVASSLGMIPTLLLVQHVTTGLPVYLVMLAEIVAGGGSYVLCLYLLKALNHKDFELLRNAFPSLKRYITISEKVISR